MNEKILPPDSMTNEPEFGTTYFVILLPYGRVFSWIWQGDILDQRALDCGLAYATKEDAEENVKAMFGTKETTR